MLKGFTDFGVNFRAGCLAIAVGKRKKLVIIMLHNGKNARLRRMKKMGKPIVVGGSWVLVALQRSRNRAVL
jgi:hypothetical protein